MNQRQVAMPEMRADQTCVKKLIADTIIRLCQEGLRYSTELKIQGVVAVTVDRCDTFVVQVDVTTTQNENTTKRNSESREDKKNYTDNDDVIEVLPVVDLTRQEELPPKPSTPRTPSTPRGQINRGRRGVSSRSLFAQPVSPQVAASPQRCRTQLTLSNCVPVGVASQVTSNPSRFSGPGLMSSSPAPACRSHKPTSDAVMVIEDDKDDVVIVASDQRINNRGGASEKRMQQMVSDASVSNPPSPSVNGKIPSRVSLNSDRCNSSKAITHANLAIHDYAVDEQVSHRATSDALNVSSFSPGTSFLPSSVQSPSVYGLKTPDRPVPHQDVIITSAVSKSSVTGGEAPRPFMVTSSASSQFISLSPTVSDSPSPFLASTHANPKGINTQIFQSLNGISGLSATNLNPGSYKEVQNCKFEEQHPVDTAAVLHQRRAYHIIDSDSDLKVNVNSSSVDQTTHEVDDSCVQPLPIVAQCRGNVVGQVTMDPMSSMSNATSQAKVVTVTCVGLNCSSPNPFIHSSAQREETEDYQKRVELVSKPQATLNADARQQEVHPWTTKTESAPNSDSQNWSQLLNVSLPTESSPPEVYTDVAEDRSNDSRHTLVMDENNEMLESIRFFTPFQCKFPGCVGSYVDGAQLANHYSITHTESLDLFQLKHSAPESTETPVASKSASEMVQNSGVKNMFPCPSKGCEFVAELFSDVSTHHRQVHSRSISPRVRQQMIWRNRDRVSHTLRESADQSKAHEDVEELQSLLPEVIAKTPVVESGDHAASSKKPLYGCLCIDGSCHWTTSSWDQLLSHMHLSHNFVIDSVKSTESSVKQEPLA